MADDACMTCFGSGAVADSLGDALDCPRCGYDDERDEIERLRAEVERLKVANGGLRASAEASIAERKRIAVDLYRQGEMLSEVAAERDAALARLAPHEALVAELREMPAEWAGAAPVLLARHGLGGDG